MVAHAVRSVFRREPTVLELLNEISNFLASTRASSSLLLLASSVPLSSSFRPLPPMVGTDCVCVPTISDLFFRGKIGNFEGYDNIILQEKSNICCGGVILVLALRTGNAVVVLLHSGPAHVPKGAYLTMGAWEVQKNLEVRIRWYALFGTVDLRNGLKLRTQLVVARLEPRVLV